MSDSEDSDTAIVAHNRQRALFRAQSSSPPPPAAAAAAPAAARRAPPRFLGDDHDSPAKGTATHSDALDDLFSGLDDIRNAPVPKRLDATAFDRLLASGASTRERGNGTEAGATEGGDNVWNVDGGDVDGVVQKKRRVVAKMDEARLLGPSGFPRLLEDINKFKLKGKGHEAQDLKRVMSMYQLWAHQMYPKTNLRDTLKTVEKLCHKRAVQTELRRYRDDAKHGKRDDAAERPASDAEGDEPSLVPFGAGFVPSQSRPRPSTSTSATSAPAPAPVTLAGDIDFDDLFADEDEILAALDMDAAAAPPQPIAPMKQQQPDDDDEEAMLAMAEAGGFDEDEEAEMAMREMEGM